MLNARNDFSRLNDDVQFVRNTLCRDAAASCHSQCHGIRGILGAGALHDKYPRSRYSNRAQHEQRDPCRAEDCDTAARVSGGAAVGVDAIHA